MNKNDIEHLYTIYGKQIFLYALTLCKNWHSAEDLTSEAFYKALLSLDDDVKNIKSWLFRVCRNLFIDDYRKKKREVIQEIEDDCLSSGEAGPLDTVLKDDAHQKLYLAIMKLSQSDREILVMYYFLNCDIKQISIHFARTTGATKTSLSRARSRLKKVLEEENYE